MERPLVHTQFWPWASPRLPGGDSIHQSIICPCVLLFVRASIHRSVLPSIYPSTHLNTHPFSTDWVPTTDQEPYQVLVGDIEVVSPPGDLM